MPKQKTEARHPAKLKELLRIQQMQPFRPFTIELVSGRRFTVPQPHKINVELVPERIAIFDPEFIAVFGPQDIAAILE